MPITTPAALDIIDTQLSNLDDALACGWLHPEDACNAISLWVCYAIFGELRWLRTA